MNRPDEIMDKVQVRQLQLREMSLLPGFGSVGVLTALMLFSVFSPSGWPPGKYSDGPILSCVVLGWLSTGEGTLCQCTVYSGISGVPYPVSRASPGRPTWTLFGAGTHFFSFAIMAAILDPVDLLA